MPELPEVETIRRGIAANSTGRVVTGVVADDSRVFRLNPNGGRDVEEFAIGKRILGLGRRGKFMWASFDGTDSVLVIHLGMSGKVLFDSDYQVPRDKHEHLRLELDSSAVLRFIDPRMFGHLSVSNIACGIPAAIAHIGADPFAADFDEAVVADRVRKSRRPIKTLLLDQTVVSGIGNIYADEALFRARLFGGTLGQDLGKKQVFDVLKGAKAAMAAALEVGGTSFDSMYVDAEGQPGYFSRQLAVYGRAGEECLECGTEITRVVLDGRSHFYCPVCQVDYR
jgi:formamidopyrimidine-DNA glycosylase (fpg)